jgi:hypothetical protein
MPPLVKVVYNDYAVDVFNEAGEHVGSITKQRMRQRTVSTYLVADALQMILTRLGNDVVLSEDKPKPREYPPLGLTATFCQSHISHGKVVESITTKVKI